MMSFLRQLLSHRAGQYYLFVTLMVATPLIVLVGIGYYYLVVNGWLLWFSLSLLVLSLVTLLLRYFLLREQTQLEQQAEDNQESVHLRPIPDWSSYDLKVWEASLANIARLELATVDWEGSPAAMLDQLAFVAGNYHQNTSNAKYAFTVPELLLMMEVCSREYRSLVLTNVPLSQNIKVSTLMGISDTSTRVYGVYKKFSPILDIVRAVLTAGTSVPVQIATKLGAEFGKGLTDHMQKNLKQLLFEQVSQVAIDLYSGRLKLSDDEMSLYRQSLPPVEEAPIRPLAVMVVGQVNAGKSSLVNALKEQSVAEVDVLPATAGFHHYHLTLIEGLDITLMDSPGLDGNKRLSSNLLEEASKADLLLWLSQANQPAKALDKDFMNEWDSYFDTHLSRKKPPVLLVTTHNDMLKPQHSWHPPYDLTDTEDRKAQSIVEAYRYTQEALGLEDGVPVVPIALKSGEAPYNIDVLQDFLVKLSGEARAAQLNRERLDGSDAATVVTKALLQTAGLASKGVMLIFR
ncbi:MAG: GTPase [Motiliproteus sp.]